MDANRQELMLMSEIMLELSYQSMIEPYDALPLTTLMSTVLRPAPLRPMRISAPVSPLPVRFMAGPWMCCRLSVMWGMLEVLTGDNYVTGETLGIL